MAKVEVTMPKMGESITEGTVVAWYKEPGDAVEQDETLLEIGTDKVDTEVPSPAAGTLAERLVEEGETVEVGTVIAMLETEEEVAADEMTPDAPTDAAEEESGADVSGADMSGADDKPAPAPETADAAAEETAGDRAAGAPDAGGSGDGEEIEVTMPKMGESITEGTLVAWYKEPGDRVELDETLLEIGTDKVDTEVPSPAAGTLKEQLVEEGETVEVGTRIAIIASESAASTAGAAAPSAPEPSEETPAAEDATEAVDTSAPSGDGAVPEPAPSGGDREPIKRRGSDGRFYSPLVRSIAEEENLSMRELESIEGSGRGGRVTKDDVLGYLDEREERLRELQQQAREEREAQPQETGRDAPQEAPSPGSRQAPERTARPGYSIDYSPDADELKQTYGDRIEVQEMDRMRKITAEHMVRSKATSAHVTSFAEADVTGLVKFRNRHKADFQEETGVKLTFTPFFVQAAVEALRDHPVLNASVEGDKIVIKKDYHVGIAVAIGQKGLLAPVIRNAGDLNLVGLAKRAANMADRARNKQLQPDELQGGTFTVTNIGSLGSIMGTPIINQPQVGILATGAIKKRPVVIEDPELGDIIAVRHIMYACLSYDHRIIDGAMGASFLQSFVDELEAYSEDDALV
jgi:2-oxoglutarate dehydrogenase E2 component (dihydrolipoamide succinyltransferase)